MAKEILSLNGGMVAAGLFVSQEDCQVSIWLCCVVGLSISPIAAAADTTAQADEGRAQREFSMHYIAPKGAYTLTVSLGMRVYGDIH